MKITQALNREKYSTIDSIKHLKTQPLNSVGNLIPTVISLVAAVGFIVALILFLINEGYPDQGFLKEFTAGTTGLFYSGVIPTIILPLLIAELVILMVLFFKSAEKAGRIKAAVSLGVLSLFVVIPAIFYAINAAYYMGLIPEEVAEALRRCIQQIPSKMEVLALLQAAALFIPPAIIIIEMRKTECKQMLSHAAISALLAFAILPLALWTIENIVNLVAWLITLIVAGIALWLFGLFAKAVESPDEEFESAKREPPRRNPPADPIPTKPVPKEPEHRDQCYQLNNPRFFREGDYVCHCAITLILGDDDYEKEPLRICKVRDFESGQIWIYNNGKRVLLVAGCQPPAY